ncbi:MAG: NADH-quinone oxidoreductase subunit J [Rhodospirillales bacterium]|nr:NADH-quinone oxidoreductase subunit J [Rhodospirillales bacterium]
MIVQALAFYIFAAVAILSGLMVISARNPVHSVLFLILAFFNAAGLFVLLGAEFLAMILVVVYVGAVAVMFMFVVMMLDINFAELRQGFLRYLPIGGLVGMILLVELLVILGGWKLSPAASSAVATTVAPALDNVSNTDALGRLIYTHYLYLFQAAGIVLLIAMIGAIVLTHRQRPGARRQNIARQVNRRPEDTLEIRKVASGKGV